MDSEIRSKIEEIWSKGRISSRTKDHGEAKALHDELDREIFEWETTLPELGSVVDVSEMSAAMAAFTLWRVIIHYCRETGESPSWEVMLLSSENDKNHFAGHNEGGAWRVCYEGGPWGWGIDLCGEVQPFLKEVTGLFRSKYFIGEPYYSFDICFSPQ